MFTQAHSIIIALGILLSTISIVRAHVVEQLFMDFSADQQEWNAELRFDAGFALPEMRANKEALQPRHEWFTEQSPQQLQRLKDEAESYLRECISFSWELGNGETSTLGFSSRYPAWDHSPPKFDLRFTDVGYAYFSIMLHGELPKTQGALILHIAEGQHPDFVIGYDRMGEDRVLTTFPGKSILIWDHEGQSPSAPQSFYHFIEYGYRHVIPDGIDHVLFIAALCFLGLHWRPLLYQSLVFTLGHSITLALAVLEVIPGPTVISGPWIEAGIAATICYVALENLRLKEVKYHRVLTIFVFGLIHGLGFASVLSNGIRSSDAVTLPLIAANLGVEFGQITVIAAIFLCFFYIRGKASFQWVRMLASLAIAVTSAFWVVERVIIAIQ